VLSIIFCIIQIFVAISTSCWLEVLLCKFLSCSCLWGSFG